MRKVQNEPMELEDLEIEQEDSFDKIYKGEISKSGAAILPSKRIRRMPEKSLKTEKEVKDKEDKEDTEETKDLSIKEKAE